ncbi:MAG: hypothetical protein HXY20_04105 [Acidobacteria bacterium]|nr:hypothetical protein [Acidobacteriota bacterium]
MGQIAKGGIATIQECLRFAWSQEIDTLVSGVETVQQREENVLACKTFEKMLPEEIGTLLARMAKGAVGAKIEQYKRP